jgi:hypothetical protein
MIELVVTRADGIIGTRNVEAARTSRHAVQRRNRQSGASASAASLAVDPELARGELRHLRQERDRLRAKVQRGLGQQVEQAGHVGLERRIRELGDELQQRGLALVQARAERDELRAKLSEADDTVAALRQSLKQMMRDQSI